MQYDHILVYIGSFGKWQKFMFLYVSLVAIGNGMLTMQQSFILYKPEFRCKVRICDGNATEYDASHAAFSIPFWDIDNLNDSAKEIKSCDAFKLKPEAQTCEEQSFLESYKVCQDGHIFSNKPSEFGNSFIPFVDDELGLCESDWPLDPAIPKEAFLGMAYMFGMLIGSVIVGYLADQFGRKSLCIVTIGLSAIFTFSSAFSQNFWTWFSLRFLAGLFSKGLFINAFAIALETVGSDWRMLLGIIIEIPYAIGEMLVGLLAYLVQDWRDLQITTGVLISLLVGLYFVLPESPRWLIAERKYEKAKKIIMKGAALNGKDIPKELLDLDNIQEETDEELLGFIDLFSRWYVASNTLVMFVNWIVSVMCFYGLSLNSVNLDGNSYLNFVLSALIEIPSYIFVCLIMDGLGRKPVLIFCQLLAGICCIAAGFVDSAESTTGSWLVVLLSLGGKFGASAAFAIVYVYTAELYPTSIRNTAVGASSTIGRIGSILAPLLATFENSLANSIMGGAAIVGGVLALLLPETLGLPLPKTLDDIQALRKNPKHWYQWMSRNELKRRQQVEINTVENALKMENTEATMSIPKISIVPATPNLPRKFNEPRDKVDGVMVCEDKREVSQDHNQAKVPKNDVTGIKTASENKITGADSLEDHKDFVEVTVMVTDHPSDSEQTIHSTSGNQPITVVVDIEKAPEPTDHNENRCEKEKASIDTSEGEAPTSESRSVEGENDSEKWLEKREEVPILELPKSSPIPTEKLAFPQGSSLKSRKISQLPVAPKDSPNAVPIGKFVRIPRTEYDDMAIVEAAVVKNQNKTHLAASLSYPETRSRKFSQLAPAPKDSPNAVQMGNKFIMIPREIDENENHM